MKNSLKKYKKLKIDIIEERPPKFSKHLITSFNFFYEGPVNHYTVNWSKWSHIEVFTQNITFFLNKNNFILNVLVQMAWKTDARKVNERNLQENCHWSIYFVTNIHCVLLLHCRTFGEKTFGSMHWWAEIQVSNCFHSWFVYLATISVP